MNELEKKSSDVMQVAMAISINSNDDEQFAVEYCKVVKKMQKEVSDSYDPIVEKAHEAHKEAVSQRNKYLNPLLEIEKKIKQLIKDYRLKLERERQEEERIAKERLDRSVKEEQARLMAEAVEASKAGDELKASALAIQSVSIEAGGVFRESKAVKQEGMSSTIVLKGRVIDIKLLPEQFLIITANQKAIDAHIKSYGDDNKIPGVEYYQDVNLSVRS